MPKKKGLHKSIKLYLSKLKKMPTSLGQLSSSPTTSTPSRLLSACKYPKTPSFTAGRQAYPAAATLSDVDRFLCEHFNSLYPRRVGGRHHDDEDDNDEEPTTPESPRHSPPPSAVPKSDRFFISPATSGSIAPATADDDSSLSSPPLSPESSCAAGEVPGCGVAVMTFSKEPYEDFRRSMKDMMDARHVGPKQPLDWDFMEELLFCYLELNDRSVHKYILKAFTDLTVSFRRGESERLRRAPAVRRRSANSAAVGDAGRRFPVGR
ncbi:hypothetical protein HPP92_005256 [Vanilla planifolia]|uniref:Transcription repressor n=1 Tax=Vanilla planifolia TaxID=51239 RepID=A0A835VC98_VANPL|nr:hypothetical protein HPP92_005541 [Vanilla planifolia]KAG0494262.1 hypothetical protein HPP92_005256 [Vanilla planifolia]